MSIFSAIFSTWFPETSDISVFASSPLSLLRQSRCTVPPEMTSMVESQWHHWVSLFCLIGFFTSQSTIIQLCRNGSSWVEPVLSKDNVSCSRTQHSWRQWGSNPRPLSLESSYHWATVLPHWMSLNAINSIVLMTSIEESQLHHWMSFNDINGIVSMALIYVSQWHQLRSLNDINSKISITSLWEYQWHW